eukprot:1797825-Prymnesium_polylepis.1
MFLGALHAAVSLQCIGALLGVRNVVDTLALMVAVHAGQFLIGVWRMLANRAAFKAAGTTPTIDVLLGAGGGPAIGALGVGLGSLAAILK